MAEAPLLPGECTVETACKLLRMSQRQFMRLQADGWIKRNERGKLEIIGVVHGGLDYTDDLIKRASARSKQNRFTEIKAREVEQRIAREDGILMETQDALDVLERVVGWSRSALESVPNRLTRDVLLRREYQKEVAIVLAELANQRRAALAELRSGVAGLEDDDASWPEDATDQAADGRAGIRPE
jgi:hypothetical protein